MVNALGRFAPFERSETLGARVRDQLRSAIMEGHFRPGDKLTLRALASSLGVSLTPAREALFNLAAEGVLEMRSNGSVYIPEMNVDDFRELTKTRMALEGLAAREATAKLTEADLAQIQRTNSELIEADKARDFNKLVSLNWQFHFGIYAAAAMPFNLKLIESCWLRSGSYVNLIYPDFASTDVGIRNHMAVIEELRRRDADAVAAAVQHDIKTSSKAFLALIEQT